MPEQLAFPDVGTIRTLNPHQFRYEEPQMGSQQHSITVDMGGQGQPKDSAFMVWNRREISLIGVPDEYQRQGVATALWHEGHRLAKQTQSIPQPKHSPDRTEKGDAWARSVGGRLPRRR